ncbi:MAG: hypothetical protein LC749_08890 [Actinobacteria bacterium]|nr:hypothetical protein [Actinomycetota bacterium]
MAIQPFDAVEPVNRDWEVNTRLAAMAFWRQLRTLHDPEVVASLARDVLCTYRETAIAAGEPYYAGRYDNLLDATQDGGHVRSSDRATAEREGRRHSGRRTSGTPPDRLGRSAHAIHQILAQAKCGE